MRQADHAQHGGIGSLLNHAKLAAADPCPRGESLFGEPRFARVVLICSASFPSSFLGTLHASSRLYSAFSLAVAEDQTSLKCLHRTSHHCAFGA